MIYQRMQSYWKMCHALRHQPAMRQIALQYFKAMKRTNLEPKALSFVKELQQ